VKRSAFAVVASVAVTGAATIVTEREASAAPSARLVYVRDKGAEDCPDEAALRAAVSTRLGYDPFMLDASSTLFAEITRTAAGYHARVKLEDESSATRGARDLDHARCPDLVDAMALTISIAIDPKSLVGPVAADPEPAPTPLPVPVPVPVPVPDQAPAPSPAPSPARAKSPPPHFFVTLSPTASFGAAPAAAVGLIGAFGLAYHPFSIALEARGDLPASRELPRGTVSTSLLAATLAPCFRGGIALACPLLSVGRLVAEARGIASPREDTAVHALGGARLGIVESLTNTVDLRANVDVLYAFTPQELRIDDQDVYTLPRLSVQLGLGLVLHFF
jgi:hypothetical protein